MPAGREIVYLVRSWPRLSQTFVLDEVLGLERLGVPLRIVALSEPRESRVQPEVTATRASVHYLGGGHRGGGHRPGSLRAFAMHARAALTAPGRYLRAAWHTSRHPEWDAGYHVATRWQCLTLAAELAVLLRRWSRGASPERVGHLHAHFAHDPAAIAMLASMLTGISWSFTGHARDVWQVPGPALAHRVRSARFTVTCSGDVAGHLRSLVPPPMRDRVRLVHHGVDVDAFRPDPGGSPGGKGAGAIVSVGRLVEKKGFLDLLEALRMLEGMGVPFHCTIYGEGPLESELAARIDELGLTTDVSLAGARTRGELRRALQRSDLFVLTPHVTSDGDRDGIPNVLVEAMACGLTVVATDTGGIPEIVHDGENGLLAPARDVSAIADRIASALADPGLRARLGATARRTTVEGFDQRQGASALATLFAGAAAR